VCGERIECRSWDLENEKLRVCWSEMLYIKCNFYGEVNTESNRE
jgi:hypothetical protein